MIIILKQGERILYISVHLRLIDELLKSANGN